MKRRQEQKALRMLSLVLLGVVVGLVVLLLFKQRVQPEQLIAWGLKDVSSVPKQQSSADGMYADAESGVGRGAMPDVFDPNTADSATLVAVGLSSWQAQNVLRYRRKGGQYHRPEDFKRLYGLTVSQWETLEPRIRIGRKFQYLSDAEDVGTSYSARYDRRAYRNAMYASAGKGAAHSFSDDGAEHADTLLHSTHPFRSSAYVHKLRKGETVDISLCDTTALKTIPGIGGYYARRIAEYGEKLGGYASLSQLNDDALSFLPVGVEGYMTLNSPSVRKLRVNHMSVRELAAHPYISFAQAKQIYNSVRVNGPLRSWTELLFLSEFTEGDRQRLEPYVEF